MNPSFIFMLMLVLGVLITISSTSSSSLFISAQESSLHGANSMDSDMPSDFYTTKEGETYPPMPSSGSDWNPYYTTKKGETYPPMPSPGSGSSWNPYYTTKEGETYPPMPSSGSGWNQPVPNADLLVLKAIEDRHTWAKPIPQAPTCPQGFQDEGYREMLFDEMIKYSVTDGARWFAGNYSSEFKDGFDLECLLNYYNSNVKGSSTVGMECLNNGGGSHWTPGPGGSGSWDTNFPSSDMPSGTTSNPNAGGTTQNPLSSIISELISSVISSVFESMLASTAAPSGAPSGGVTPAPSSIGGTSPSNLGRDAEAESFSGDANDGSVSHAPNSADSLPLSLSGSGNHHGSDSQYQSFPPNGPTIDPIPASHSQMTGSPFSGSGSHNPSGPSPPTGTTPACAPFGDQAKCVLYSNIMLQVVILRKWKAQYPGCFCSTDCPTYTTHTTFTYPSNPWSTQTQKPW